MVKLWQAIGLEKPDSDFGMPGRTKQKKVGTMSSSCMSGSIILQRNEFGEYRLLLEVKLPNGKTSIRDTIMPDFNTHQHVDIDKFKQMFAEKAKKRCNDAQLNWKV